MTTTRNHSLWILAGFMLATGIAATFGGYFTTKAVITVAYAELLKPNWAPPAWAFGPVWTLLYVCMSVAAWMVWKNGKQQPVRRNLVLWWGQLVVNAGWPVAFYLQPSGLAPALVCGGLTCLVGLCCCMFFRCSRFAAALMVPYLLWICLATALSFSMWQLNW